jgi:hypothetical protein
MSTGHSIPAHPIRVSSDSFRWDGHRPLKIGIEGAAVESAINQLLREDGRRHVSTNKPDVRLQSIQFRKTALLGKRAVSM